MKSTINAHKKLTEKFRKTASWMHN